MYGVVISICYDSKLWIWQMIIDQCSTTNKMNTSQFIKIDQEVMYLFCIVRSNEFVLKYLSRLLILMILIFKCDQISGAP